MLNPEAEALRLVAQSAILAAEKQRRDAEDSLRTVLFDLNSMSQSHIWDSIDFYSRPAHVEMCEMEAYGLIEDETKWIELEDYVDASIIEDYYGGGFWKLA